MISKQRKWAAVEALAGLVGAAVAGKATEAAWKRASGEAPPTAPGTRGFRWRKALAWTVVAGVTVAVAQLAATGAASAVWRKATGRRPPKRRRA